MTTIQALKIMKTLELKLKKDVLIVDLPIEAKNVYMSGNSIIYNTDKSCIAKLINDDYEFLCKGSELTEEIASELVDNIKLHKLHFADYKNNGCYKTNSILSFISAVESKGFYWLENPIEKPHNIGLLYLYPTGDILMDKSLECAKKWQEAEEKTFRNPLIFVKK